MFNDTIVAQATPQGSGGVSIVRVSGPKATDIGKKLTGKSRTPRAKTPILHAIYSRSKIIFTSAPNS